ncbi:MAG: metalloregulator ArsR/SmtB family transcription factor [Pseudomonadota bacterium]
MLTAVDFFKQLADETRLRILHLLQAEGELCVCELTDALGLAQPKISRHLASLREHGLVLDSRRGTWAFYRLHPDLPAWARQVLRDTLAGHAVQPDWQADLARLRRHPERPQACGL